MTATPAPFYVAGGTLRTNAKCYLVRLADEQLYSALREGHFAYVLTSRQMGKSSLMVRTAARLRSEGFAVAVVDLTAIGQNVSADQWYYGLAESIGDQCGLGEEKLAPLWMESTNRSALHRWTTFIEELLRQRPRDSLVVFIDEIDAVRSLSFSTDEFFAAIRHFYNRRAGEYQFERLTFCLLGVAAPADLIRNPVTTPFNIGVRIELDDFTAAEAAPLAAGFVNSNDGTRALRRILYWTGGHPYLTQRLCKAVVASPAGRNEIDQACSHTFLGSRARTLDDNLLFVRERMLHHDVDTAALLKLYGRIRRRRRVRDSDADRIITVLRLSGICRVHAGCLRVRNRIYARVFNRRWIKNSIPDAERRRQRAAFLRGLVLASAVATLVLGVITFLAYTVSQQRDENRWQLYIANIRLAEQACRRHDLVRAKEFLRAVLPEHGERDIRGFEWYSLWNFCHAERPLVSISRTLWDARLSPDGTRIFGVAPGEVVELDVQTGALLRHVLPIPFDLHPSLALSPDGRLLAVRSVGKLTIVDFRSGVVSHLDAYNPTEESMGELAPIAQGSFFPDSRALISAVGNSCILWQAPAWAPKFTHRANGTIRRVSISPDQRKIALATRDIVEVWSADFSKKIVSISANQPSSLTFSNDGRYLACGDYGSIQIVDLITGRTTKWATHHGLGGAAVFSPDGKWLVSAGADDVRMWDWRSQRELRSFGRYPSGSQVAFFPDGRKLLIGGDGIDIWDPDHWQPEMLGDDEIYAIAFSADDSYFVSGGNDGRLILWGTVSRIRLRSYHVGERVEQLAFVAANLILVNTTHRAVVWNLAADKPVDVLADSNVHLMAAVAPDRKTFAIADAATRELKLLDAATHRVRVRKSLATVPMGLAFARDSRTVAIGLNDGQVQVFSGGQNRRLSGGRGVARVLAFSPANQQLLVGYDSAQIYAWDWRRQQKVAVLAGHNGPIKCIQFSPDGTRLVSTSDDGTMKIWDASTFQEIVTLPESEQSMEVVAFSPDSRFLATAGDDRRIRLWDGLRVP